MPEEPLPVYQIQDFGEPLQQPHFYLQTLEAHLREHAFIQRPHKHDFYLLLLFTQGSGTHTIDFRTYPVGPGTAFFLDPGQVHAWQLSADSAGYVIFFSPEFYLLGFPEKKLFSFPFFGFSRHQPFLQLNETETAAIVTIIKTIEKEKAVRAWKQEDVLRNYLDILLIRLSRIYLKAPALEGTASANFSVLRQLENLIDRHFREHQPVSFYADHLHLTQKQLNDLSRHALKKTTADLIRDRLVLEARRLLIHSDQNITQIAAALGYFDNSYFSRFFKKHTGQSPEQFRQQVMLNS
jgi:AraC family transcriptional activator of pobA